MDAPPGEVTVAAAAAVAWMIALGAVPWEGEPFAAEPRALAEAAARLPVSPDADPDILAEEFRLAIDAQGRAVQTLRLVLVPRSPATASAWAELRRTFSPWHQDRPEIRARVVSATGEARWLDPSTITEGAPEGRDLVFSDRRMLRAPLPAVAPGAVIEVVTVHRDQQPFFEGGAVYQIAPGNALPARRFHLRVEAPASLPLRHRATGLPPGREAVSEGRRVLEWEVAPRPRAPEQEPLLPPDQAAPRQVAISTGRSWQEVARRYAEVVEQQLAGADLADTAHQVAAPRDPPEVAAQKVMDWIGARTRYTSLALGEAALVPARPATTLERRYGDCKDLSLLAVGLLRAAGHPASLALLRARPDEIDPDLPGLGPFDHAVVRVGGERPVWLDLTGPGTSAGELPPALQGRLALVADPGTAELVRTPETGPEDNRVAIIRRIDLTRPGRARVSEESEQWGAQAAELRRLVLPSDAAAREGVARVRLGAAQGTPVTVRFHPAASRGEAALLTFTAESSSWGGFEGEKAEVVVGPNPVFDGLPPPFWKAARGKGAEEPAPRRGDLLLPAAYQAELRYHVLAPPGFQAGPLPAGERIAVGPATFESSFGAEPDGSVRALYRFEASRRRLTAAEVDRLRQLVAAQTREDGPRVRFSRRSDLLLAAGKGREALDEIRQLAALEPRAAPHRVRLALALLRLGLGETARREARAAVELEPELEWAQRSVAFTLEHDLLGRRLRPGCDLQGAITAWKRAVKMAPHSVLAHGGLASALLYGPGLELFGPGARLDEALAELRLVHDELKSHDLDEGYLAALFGAERFPEALRLAREMAPGARRNAILLAAATLHEGAEGPARELEGLPSEARAVASHGAVLELMHGRHYAAARTLTERLRLGEGADRELARLLALLPRTRRIEEIPVAPGEPTAVPLRLLRALGADASARQELLATWQRPGPRIEEAIGTFRDYMAPAHAFFGTRAALDVTASALEVRAVPYGTAQRLDLSLQLPGATARPVFLVVRQEGEWKLAALHPQPADLGWVALQLLRTGDRDGARRLLVWAQEGLAEKNGQRTVVAALATDRDEVDEDRLLRLAAALAAMGDRGLAAVPILEEHRDRATAEERRALTLALAAGSCQARQWQRCRRAAEEFLAGGPTPRDEGGARDLLVRSLRQLGLAAETRALGEARLRATPDDLPGLRMVAQSAGDLADHDASAEAYRSLLATGKTIPGDLNNAAWGALFREPIDPEARSLARRSSEVPLGAAPRSTAALHTLASVHAALGEPQQAVEALRRAAEAPGRALSPADWLVLGRVAEEYGLLDEAAEWYGRVSAPDFPSAISVQALAQRWKEALKRRRAR